MRRCGGDQWSVRLEVEIKEQAVESIQVAYCLVQKLQPIGKETLWLMAGGNEDDDDDDTDAKAEDCGDENNDNGEDENSDNGESEDYIDEDGDWRWW